jgi:hypothetical protein
LVEGAISFDAGNTSLKIGWSDLNNGQEAAPRGVRIVYMDTTRDLPGMLEIIETTDALEAIYQSYFDAAQNWNGEDPVRRWSLKASA